VELVDTRDLKSLARLSMRVRVPPVLPSKNYSKDYEKLKTLLTIDTEDTFVYNHRGQIVNINTVWR
jgi:hypothetical protein